MVDLKYVFLVIVSCCGMVYVDFKNFGFKLFFKIWFEGVGVKYREMLLCMFDKYMDRMMVFCYDGIEFDG